MVTATRFTTADIGCYFDGARGVYIGEAIQEWAAQEGSPQGARFGEVYCHHNGDTGIICPCPGEDDHGQWYHEATTEAEDYLNTLTADDVSFGPSEQGDWGLWHLCDDDLDCEFCENL